MNKFLIFLLILTMWGAIYVSSTDPRGFGYVPRYAFPIVFIEEKK